MVNNKVFLYSYGDRVAQIEIVRELETDVYEIDERPMQKTDRDGFWKHRVN